MGIGCTLCKERTNSGSMMTASVDSGFAIMDELIYAKPVQKRKICKNVEKN